MQILSFLSISNIFLYITLLIIPYLLIFIINTFYSSLTRPSALDPRDFAILPDLLR